MSPIRIALVGLSAATKTSWAANAHLPYLLSSHGKQKYKIVALLNSSKDAAGKAIQAFNLPHEVKAYGSPDELAADPDVDLAVICTRVDVHYQIARPLVTAGKNVYVEWPLAQNKTNAKELADLAKANGSKTFVGLQARTAPYVEKIRQVLEAGTIGKVVSSDFKSYHSSTPSQGLPEGLEYFTDSKIGGNVITIAFAHTIDGIHAVLGEYQTSTGQAAQVRPTANIIADGKILRQVPSDVPDEVFVVGSLPGSSTVRDGAILTLSYRRNPVPFPDEPAFSWSIYGESGQIRVTMQPNTFWNVESDSLTIRLQKYGNDTIEVIPWQAEPWQEGLPTSSKNIATLYERYADGKEVATFETAVQRHNQVDDIISNFQ